MIDIAFLPFQSQLSSFSLQSCLVNFLTFGRTAARLVFMKDFCVSGNVLSNLNSLYSMV